MVFKIKKILFPNKNKSSSNGFCVFLANCLLCDDSEKENTEIIVKGKNMPLVTNMTIDADGYWKEDKNGESFCVTAYIAYASDKEGIISVLTPICECVKENSSQLIYEYFGENTLEILDEDPVRIKELKTLSGREKAEIYKNYIYRRLKVTYGRELKKLGICESYISKIIYAYKERAVPIVYLDPYIVVSKGIPFIYIEKMVNDNSLNLGEDAKKHRIRACLIDILFQAESGGMFFRQNAGHCCIPYKLWIDNAQGLLKVSDVELNSVIESMAYNKRIYLAQQNGEIYVYRNDTYKAEVKTAEYIKKLSKSQIKRIKNIESEIALKEKKAGFCLAPEQKNAVITCLANTFSVITGGPGTGKSTILDFIKEIYLRNNKGKKILMLAPTGRAAQRMAETTGCKANTIHKGLKLKICESGDFGKPEPIYADFILIDEISMLDIYIAEKLFSSIRPGTKVVLIGDVEQLPSVGAGAVLNDIIESGAVPVARLTKVYRQAGDSSIAINANLIKNGKSDFDYDNNYIYVESDNFEDAADKIKNIYVEEVKKEGIENVVFLSPYRVKGTATSVENFNEAIHDIINPPENKPNIKIKGNIFRVGDKIMSTANTVYAANGDVGYINNIVGDNIYISFEGNDEVIYNRTEMENTVLAYATTVHKYQGSEYKVVIFNLQDEHGIMKKRNLLYTAITRAKQRVYIVGSKKAISEAVQCGIRDKDKRITLLADRLQS